MPRPAGRSATGKLVSPARFTSSIAASKLASRASDSAAESRLARPATSWPRSSSMSSIFIATSISSSTTRIRSERSAAIRRLRGHFGEGGVDRAAQAVRFEGEVRRAAEIGAEAVLDEASAEAVAGRRRDHRAALLLPLDQQALAG